MERNDEIADNMQGMLVDKTISQAFQKTIDDWLEIKKQIDEIPNNPEKIFEKFNLPAINIGNVKCQGSGFKKTYEWNGKQYKRPELVAKAFYEEKGYLVSWSEGVGWGIVIKSLLALLSLSMGRFFEVVDTREQELVWARSAAEHLEFNFKIHELHGPPLFYEKALKRVEDNYRERIARLKGENNTYEYKMREIIIAIHNNDDVMLRKHLNNYKLQTTLDINLLRVKLAESVEEISNEKNLELIENFYPEIGQIIFNEYRDKYNLTEWTIKFAKDILAKLDWKIIYSKYLDACGHYEVRFDLTVIDADRNDIKFVEVKVNDKFTEFQRQDLVYALQYNLPIELAIIET